MAPARLAPVVRAVKAAARHTVGSHKTSEPLPIESTSPKHFTKDGLQVSRILGPIPPDMPWPRRRVVLALEHKIWDMLLAIIILLNLVVAIVETDATVDDGQEPFWVGAANAVLLIIYSIELAMRAFAYRSKIFVDGWTIVDSVVVGSDITLVALDFIFGNMPRVAVLRAFRLVRLIRAFKALAVLPELNALLSGFVCAIKAIIWGMILILMVITICGILAVQLIHPFNRKVAEMGIYDRAGCERCPDAFSSVFESMLTIFQGIVAGDSWGQVSIPIIQNFPQTAPYFLLVLVTISLAMMNLILAVIVERAQDNRAKTDAELAEEEAMRFRGSAAKLHHLFEVLDVDGNGLLSKEELLAGIDEKEFADLVKIMGLKRADMGLLFDILDSDGSGDVRYAEFVQQLYRFRDPDLHTLIMEMAKMQKKIIAIATTFKKALEATNGAPMIVREVSGAGPLFRESSTSTSSPQTRAAASLEPCREDSPQLSCTANGIAVNGGVASSFSAEAELRLGSRGGGGAVAPPTVTWSPSTNSAPFESSAASEQQLTELTQLVKQVLCRVDEHGRLLSRLTSAPPAGGGMPQPLEGLGNDVAGASASCSTAASAPPASGDDPTFCSDLASLEAFVEAATLEEQTMVVSMPDGSTPRKLWTLWAPGPEPEHGKANGCGGDDCVTDEAVPMHLPLAQNCR